MCAGIQSQGKQRAPGIDDPLSLETIQRSTVGAWRTNHAGSWSSELLTAVAGVTRVQRMP